MTSKDKTHIRLVGIIDQMGFPEEFGELIADSLGTEKQMQRMISWLIQYKPERAEDIADEMLAIQEQFECFKQKAIGEYTNRKINILLNDGLGEEE